MLINLSVNTIIIYLSDFFVRHPAQQGYEHKLQKIYRK